MNAYHALAASYDRLTKDVDYEATVEFYMEILRREGLKPRTCVDLACGTGSVTKILAQKGYDVMIENLKNSENKDLATATNCEYNINECRNHLREEHIVNIESDSYNYLTGVYYMDVLAQLEKIGDFLINISQALVGKYEYEA